MPTFTSISGGDESSDVTDKGSPELLVINLQLTSVSCDESKDLQTRISLEDFACLRLMANL